MTYEQHMTTEYDAQFEAAKTQELKWYPWVGKAYRQTGIFVLGISTDDRDEGWKECAENDPQAMRKIDLTFANPNNDKSYKTFSNMFFDEAGTEEYKMLWSSIAFHNFVQAVVSKGGDMIPDDPVVIEQSKNALNAIIDIIKPKLCVVWSVDFDAMGLENYVCRNQIGGKKGAYPRVIDQTPEKPPIVGIRHPSKYFVGADWLDFLRNDPASKKPVETLLTHLKQTIN